MPQKKKVIIWVKSTYMKFTLFDLGLLELEGQGSMYDIQILPF